MELIAASKQSSSNRKFSVRRLRLLVVVASTGGPLAIQQVLSKLPEKCPVPVLLIQHMPAAFTQSFAARLDALCHITVKEAQQGDVLKAGLALLAPGGRQMEIKVDRTGEFRVELRDKLASELYAPSADITLSSVAALYRGQSLVVILTGMGVDGKAGASKMKQAGSTIWAQHEDSCTVYGMPKAVVDAQLADKIFSLDQIALEFTKLVK